MKDQEVPPLERIRNYLEHSIEHLAEHDFTRGCLIGNLGQELADQNERFRARLAAIFADWQVKFTDCLREAQQAGTLNPAHAPEAVASFFSFRMGRGCYACKGDTVSRAVEAVCGYVVRDRLCELIFFDQINYKTGLIVIVSVIRLRLKKFMDAIGPEP